LNELTKKVRITEEVSMNPSNSMEAQFHAESTASVISWSAVIGGAFVTASLALIFMILGLGLGLSLIVPWTGAAVGVAAIVWLIATHAVSAGLGGYLAGRFRTKWSTIPRDEIYFRDTAHGFLVWAVSVVITMAFLVSVASAMVVGGADLIADMDEVVYAGPDKGISEVYVYSGKVDSHVELTARQEAEETRRATVTVSLWMFAALLIGAFCASFAATLGGRHRDTITGDSDKMKLYKT